MSQPEARERPSSHEIKIPSLGVPCEHRCAKKCTLKISQERRKTIFEAYWSMNRQDRIVWVFNSVSRDLKHRETTSPGHVSRRCMTYSYHLKADDGTSYEVCKTFFVATLGYHPKNDRFIMTALQSTSYDSVVSLTDRRGRHIPSNKLDTSPIKAHIGSFGLSISRHRHQNATNKRYLPSSVTIRFMYQDFKDKNPGTKCSYETYRKVFRESNISFVKMGVEECSKYPESEILAKDMDREQMSTEETAGDVDEMGDRRTEGTANMNTDGDGDVVIIMGNDKLVGSDTTILG